MAEILNQPDPKAARISDERRELMHRVMDGNSELAGVMHILHGYKYCDNFLKWMIENRFTGRNLQEIIVKKFRSSMPEFVDYMVAQMNSTRITDLRKKNVIPIGNGPG